MVVRSIEAQAKAADAPRQRRTVSGVTRCRPVTTLDRRRGIDAPRPTTARGTTIAGIGRGKMRIGQGGILKRRGAAAQAAGRTEVVELDSATPTAAIERAMEETRIEKRAVVTEGGGLIVTIVMEMEVGIVMEAGVGIVMQVTDMDAVAKIVAIVVMMGMIVLSAGVATAIVIVANDRAAIDMEEGVIANVVVIAPARIAAIGIDRRIAGGEVLHPVAAAAAEGETASAAIIPDRITLTEISAVEIRSIPMREG